MKLSAKLLGEKQLEEGYYSGEIETRYLEAVNSGDKPWRILRFQRIVDPENLEYPVANYTYVTPASFERCLKTLNKNCQVVPLETLITAILERRHIEPKTVALTLDGGLVDHLVYALEALEKFNTPATGLLPTSLIGSNEYFWEEKVMFIMLGLKQANIPVCPFSFFSADILEAINQTSADGRISLPLIALFIAGLAQSPLEDRLTGLYVLSRAAETYNISYPPDGMFLSWEEVIAMESKGIKFGSMSHMPDFFADLSLAEARRDIDLSAKTLGQQLSNPSPVFAFPRGVASQESVEALHQSGIPYALGTELPAIFKAPNDSFNLIPRISIHDDVAQSPAKLLAHIWHIENIVSK